MRATASTRSTTSAPAARPPGLARPLDTLVFLIPLIAFYELVTPMQPDLVADQFLRQFIALFGFIGWLAPALAVVVILLATHIASRAPWKVRWNRVGMLYVESAALAIPLFILLWGVPALFAQVGLVPVQQAAVLAASELESLAIGVGAGVYEELVFRLVLISLIMIIGHDVLRWPKGKVAFLAVACSALAFAAHHHQPFGSEPFDFSEVGHWLKFTFRSLAGVYLAGVFWIRGYGPAAGCHAAYNVALELMRISGLHFA